jgi:hypothetical protein
VVPATRAVNGAEKWAPPRQEAVNVDPRTTTPSPRSAPAPWHSGEPRTWGVDVEDLLFAGVLIVVFAVLLLAVRGLDRL